MLSELYIENLAVIEKATIDFSDKLNVFTGETGAGKSILINGINAILGQRVTKDIVSCQIMHKIKKDDMVKIIAGKDKDKTGKVLSVDSKKNEVVVEGCNMVTKHTKPSQTNQTGGIVHQEAAIDISNVMLLVDGKATRVGFEVKDGKKVRVAKATGKVID